MLIGVNVLVALAVLAVAATYGYVLYRNDQIRREKIAGLQGAAASQPETFLIVGSDTRAVVTTPADKRAFGVVQDAGGQRSDTIMLLHLDPAAKTASLLSLPRDLWVPIPGTTRSDRINTTFDKGPDLLVRTIHDDFGITVNHYVELNFVSFRGVVDAIGLVHVYFPTAARDMYSGLRIAGPGCYPMNGGTALAYVRARHYQYYLNGRWHEEGLSDLARIKRQQDFIKRVATKAISAGLTNPVKLNGIVSAVAPQLTVDSGFHLSDMIALGRKWRGFNPNALQTATMPNTPTVIGGQDVLLPKQPDVQQVINQFLGAQPSSAAGAGPAASAAPVSPGSVSIRVDNGTGRPGQAASVATALRQGGFVVSATGSAGSFGYGTTTLRYAPGAEAKAHYLAQWVVGGAQVVADPTLTGVDVVLITGATFGGIHAPNAPVAPGGSAPGANPHPAPSVQTTPPSTTPPLPGTPAVEPPCPA